MNDHIITCFQQAWTHSNRQKIRLFICYSLILTLSYGYTTSGKSFDPQGAIQEAEFIIQKERKNELPTFPKLYKQAPFMPEDAKLIFEYTWNWEKPILQFLPIEHKVKLLRTAPDKLESVYGNCFSMGYGNYYTPYIMAFLRKTIWQNYVYNIELNHISGGKKEHLETYHNQAEVDGKLFTNSVILDHTIYYHADKYPFLVLEKDKLLPQKNDPKKNLLYHQVGIATQLYNRIASNFNYKLQIEGLYLHQKKLKEPQGIVRLHLNRKLTEVFRANVDTNLQLMQYNNPINRYSKLRHVVTLTPSLNTIVQKLAISTGLKVAYQNDTHALAEKLYFYPVIRLKYTLHQAFQPYITLDGDMEPQSWATYIQQNPWINHAVAIQYVNKPFACTVGAQGDILNLQWNVGVTWSRYQNYPCFTNHAYDPRTFDIQYDSLASVTHEFIEISTYSLEKALKTLAEVKWFQYKLTDLQAPWHRPTYQLTLSNTYNFHDKIRISQQILWEGGRKANANASLPTCFNLALGLEYFWNQRVVIFIDCQNILARKNQKYLYTPTDGAHIVLGIAYKW